MANKPTTKPAAKPARGKVATKPAAKPTTKPATRKPATKPAVKTDGVGVKEVAAKLGRTPRSVRASIRRILGGAQVGKGGRYNWKSWNDPELKKLMDQMTPEEVAA